MRCETSTCNKTCIKFICSSALCCTVITQQLCFTSGICTWLLMLVRDMKHRCPSLVVSCLTIYCMPLTNSCNYLAWVTCSLLSSCSSCFSFFFILTILIDPLRNNPCCNLAIGSTVRSRCNELSSTISSKSFNPAPRVYVLLPHLYSRPHVYCAPSFHGQDRKPWSEPIAKQRMELESRRSKSTYVLLTACRHCSWKSRKFYRTKSVGNDRQRFFFTKATVKIIHLFRNVLADLGIDCPLGGAWPLRSWHASQVIDESAFYSTRSRHERAVL